MQKEESVKLGDFNPLVVQERDEKSGKVVKVRPFRVIAHKGVRFYEYPKGSGNLWFENREPAGRLNDAGEPIRGETHVEWSAPVSVDEKIGRDNATLQRENVRLQAELAAIKNEKEMDAKIAKAEPKASAQAPKAKTAPTK